MPNPPANPPDEEKITLRLPRSFVRGLDYLVQLHDFPSRSEAIRVAVKELIEERVEGAEKRHHKLQSLESKMVGLEELQREFVKK